MHFPVSEFITQTPLLAHFLLDKRLYSQLDSIHIIQQVPYQGST